MTLAALAAVVTGLVPLLLAVMEAINGHFARKHDARSALAQVEVDELDRGMRAVDDELRQLP